MIRRGKEGVGINLYKEKIEEILQKVKKQDITVDEAMQSLRGFPYEDLEFAKVDHHRSLNKGFPEVIYCPGKTTEQIIGNCRAAFRKRS